MFLLCAEQQWLDYSAAPRNGHQMELTAHSILELILHYRDQSHSNMINDPNVILTLLTSNKRQTQRNPLNVVRSKHRPFLYMIFKGNNSLTRWWKWGKLSTPWCSCCKREKHSLLQYIAHWYSDSFGIFRYLYFHCHYHILGVLSTYR